MNLEQLQAMSDDELNELSAVKVMGYKLYEEIPGGYHPFQGNYDWLENQANYPHFIKYSNGRVILWKIPSVDGRDWKPTTDMNDAMELLNKFLLWEIKNHGTIEKSVIIKDMTKPFQPVHDKNLALAITIASILAKEEQGK